ncbi:MAG: AEC family transporter, partial [Oscillospiraceae bacterium]|nr:AEC family transporter [Oscillospiraceae bacterium]
KGNRQRSVLVQAVFRSNFLLYGLPVAERISGAEGAGVVSMLLAMIIPLFNFFAVFTLEFFSDKNGKGKKFNMKPIFLEILKNPLIIAAAAGILLALFKVKLPVFLSAPIGDLAKCATPIALLSLGMQFDFKKVNTNKTYLMMGTAGRLIVVPALALAAAVFRGIGGAELTALLSLFASPAAVTSYIMAHEAGADSDLAGQLVVATTIFSSVTVFCFVFVLHSLSLI